MLLLYFSVLYLFRELFMIFWKVVVQSVIRKIYFFIILCCEWMSDPVWFTELCFCTFWLYWSLTASLSIRQFLGTASGWVLFWLIYFNIFSVYGLKQNGYQIFSLTFLLKEMKKEVIVFFFIFLQNGTINDFRFCLIDYCC